MLPASAGYADVKMPLTRAHPGRVSLSSIPRRAAVAHNLGTYADAVQSVDATTLRALTVDAPWRSPVRSQQRRSMLGGLSSAAGTNCQ